MNRRNLVRLVLAAALLWGGRGALAQQVLEIIPLRHVTVEQALSALHRLLEPGATLSGARGQLFLRASPSNVAEIKRALEAIDRPLRRLQISVRFDDAREHERRALGASGTIGSNGSRIDISAQDSRRAAGERVDQRLQVLEGSRALISSGQSRVVRTPDGVLVQELATGFEVTPRLGSGGVLLDVHAGTARGQGVVTTITTRLGEWVEIAGTASAAARDERGLASSSRTRAGESRGVWVKVEELPN
jgi:type II secretory pathway component GspD/PulD (secretin)